MAKKGDKAKKSGKKLDLILSKLAKLTDEVRALAKTQGGRGAAPAKKPKPAKKPSKPSAAKATPVRKTPAKPARKAQVAPKRPVLVAGSDATPSSRAGGQGGG